MPEFGELKAVKKSKRRESFSRPEPIGVKIPRILVDPFLFPERFIPTIHFACSHRMRTEALIEALNQLINLQEMSLGGENWTSNSHFLGIPCEISKSKHRITARMAEGGEVVIKFRMSDTDGYDVVNIQFDLGVPAESIFENIPQTWKTATTRIVGVIRNGDFSGLYASVDFQESGIRFMFTVEDYDTHCSKASQASRTYSYEEKLGPISLGHFTTEVVVDSDPISPKAKFPELNPSISIFESTDPIQKDVEYLAQIGKCLLDGTPELIPADFKFIHHHFHNKDLADSDFLSGVNKLPKGQTIRISQRIGNSEDFDNPLYILVSEKGMYTTISGTYWDKGERKQIHASFTKKNRLDDSVIYLDGSARYVDSSKVIEANYYEGALHDAKVSGKMVPAWILKRTKNGNQHRYEKHYRFGRLDGPTQRIFVDSSSSSVSETHFRRGLEHEIGGEWACGDAVKPVSYSLDVDRKTSQEINDYLHSILIEEYRNRKNPILGKWFFHPFWWEWVQYKAEDGKDEIRILLPQVDHLGGSNFFWVGSFSLNSTSVFLRPNSHVNLPNHPEIHWETAVGVGKIWEGQQKKEFSGFKPIPYSTFQDSLSRRFVGGLLERHLDATLKKTFGLEKVPPHLLSFVALVVLSSSFSKDLRLQRLLEKAMEVSLTGVGTNLLDKFLKGLQEDPSMTRVLETYIVSEGAMKELPPETISSLCEDISLEVKNDL